MANPKHLKILREVLDDGTSFRAWTEWRKRNPKVTPDFSGANLREEKINELEMDGANFSNAMLIGARLMDAELEGANLKNANLGEACLFNAKLPNANLQNAELE